MERIGGTAVLVAIVVGCSGETGEGPATACADVSGNYQASVERVAGSCDPSQDPKSVSMTMRPNGDGTWSALLPGVDGGCPGRLDAASCKFTSNCAVRTGDGSLLATVNLEYTFSKTGYTGTAVNGLLPPATATRCEVIYRETGSRL